MKNIKRYQRYKKITKDKIKKKDKLDYLYN